MDLPTAQPIIDAMAKRNAQGIFGYTSRPDSYFESVREMAGEKERLEL